MRASRLLSGCNWNPCSRPAESPTVIDLPSAAMATRVGTIRTRGCSGFGATTGIAVEAGGMTDAVVDCAARQICLASFSVEAAAADMNTVVNGTAKMRRAAAEVFATNVTVPSCRERCLVVLSTLFEHLSEVRDIASECWRRVDHDDLVREVLLIESYVESDSFPSRRERLIHHLKETRAPLPSIIIKVAERFLQFISSHSGESPHPAVYESSTIATLVVRLYSQTNDPKRSENASI